MGKLKRKNFEALMKPMQEELADLAHWVQAKGKRLEKRFVAQHGRHGLSCF